MQEKEDVLNRSEFIDKIINLVDLIVENNKGCSFAINGRWGSGKSFVLERIKEKLIREQSEDLMGDKYFVCYYNCWEYDYYEEPIISIISSISDNIQQQKNLLSNDTKQKLTSITKNITKYLVQSLVKQSTGLELEKVIGNLVDVVSDEGTREYDKLFSFRGVLDKVRNGIKEISEIQPVIIMVDELDRCLPTYTIKVLERLHHIFDGIDNVVIIIAMDKMQIKKALEKIYGDDLDIDRYLRKFISFDLYLDTGKATNFIKKYEKYISLFDIKENEYEELEKFLTDITYDIDIRTQEKIFEKAESLHRLLSTEEKMDEALMLFEILVLCIKEKTNRSDLKWIIQSNNINNNNIKKEVGQEYYEIIEKYEKSCFNGNYVDGFQNSSYKIIRDKAISKVFFLVANLYHEIVNGMCSPYYYGNPFEKEICFAKKIHMILNA
ncbi:KAP family P-loop NTPase fold protein [Anaerostipes hadrus]|jgi:hypothetical protein|uniref:KAP family P-loop NTPase fold protein n=1 Tax=Anaerostipes hadrus TaxID=649756 RepID=UPI0032BF6619